MTFTCPHCGAPVKRAKATWIEDDDERYWLTVCRHCFCELELCPGCTHHPLDKSQRCVCNCHTTLDMSAVGRAIYLSGVVRPEVIDNPRMGLIITPLMGNRPDLSRTKWAADNGCFSQPQKFNEQAYYRWLWGLRCYRRTCLFATAPDVVGNAEATLKRSLIPMAIIKHLIKLPVAFVAQDGMEDIDYTYDPEFWDRFDVLFIGGSTAWKLSSAAYDMAMLARHYGKRVHMGRVNSKKRMRAALIGGCDSMDGTFLAVAPTENYGRVQRWFDDLDAAPPLWVA